MDIAVSTLVGPFNILLNQHRIDHVSATAKEYNESAKFG
jgi:hypothetical protein